MSDCSVIVFDGVCVLCSRWVGFVLRHDRQARYRLAAMQTTVGRALLQQNGIDADDPATFLVIDKAQALTDSDAIMHVLKGFSWPWRIVAGVLRIVPRSVRNALYRAIARNRYRLFGKRESCLVPRPEQAERFLR
jgi:predicted DCC family thiol-disulfide oxidoreductase YuxK